MRKAMELETKQFENSELLLLLNGDFDAQGTQEIRQSLKNVVDNPEPKSIVLDIGGVSFIDSSGVGAIVFLFKRLKVQGRKLRITAANGQPAELLKMLRVNKAIPVELY